MLLIWGWRAVLTVLFTGRMSCPQCGTDTDFRHIAPRRYFTFFFVPVIPLEHLAPYVECAVCKGAFRVEVLMRPTMPQLEHSLGLASRAAVAHLASLVSLDAAVSAWAVEALSQAPGVRPGYGDAELAVDVVAFASPSVLATYVRPLSEHLSLEGREQVLRRAMTFAAHLRGRGGASLDAAVVAYADLLGISRTHAAGITASLDASTGTDGAQR